MHGLFVPTTVPPCTATCVLQYCDEALLYSWNTGVKSSREPQNQPVLLCYLAFQARCAVELDFSSKVELDRPKLSRLFHFTLGADRMRTGHDIKGVFGIYETALSQSIWYLPHGIWSHMGHH